MSNLGKYFIKDELPEKIAPNDLLFTDKYVNWNFPKVSTRILMFKEQGCKCATCGLEGEYFRFEYNGTIPSHPNLYAVIEGKEIQFGRNREGENGLEVICKNCQKLKHLNSAQKTANANYPYLDEYPKKELKNIIVSRVGHANGIIKKLQRIISTYHNLTNSVKLKEMPVIEFAKTVPIKWINGEIKPSKVRRFIEANFAGDTKETTLTELIEAYFENKTSNKEAYLQSLKTNNND